MVNPPQGTIREKAGLRHAMMAPTSLVASAGSPYYQHFQKSLDEFREFTDNEKSRREAVHES